MIPLYLAALTGVISGCCLDRWLIRREQRRAQTVKTVKHTDLYLAWSNPQKTVRKW